MNRTFYNILLILFLLTFWTPLCAQKVKTVSSTYIYYAPETMSVVEAKRIALDRAMIQAIADEFGTIVSESNSVYVSNMNGESNIQFFSLGGSDVKGEWIETIGEPEYDDVIYSDHMQIISCTVKGKAREIITPKVNFVAKPLRHGPEAKFEAYEFKNGDFLYMLFQAPVDGYLMIYLVDDTNEMVYCALPYRGSDGSPKRILADKEYILFSQKEADSTERRYVDEYEMTCDKEIEYNDFYILFSEESFSKMIMPEQNQSKLPKIADIKEFQKWLAQVRIKNPKLTLEKISIKISKN